MQFVNQAAERAGRSRLQSWVNSSWGSWLRWSTVQSCLQSWLKLLTKLATRPDSSRMRPQRTSASVRFSVFVLVADVSFSRKRTASEQKRQEEVELKKTQLRSLDMHNFTNNRSQRHGMHMTYSVVSFHGFEKLCHEPLSTFTRKAGDCSSKADHTRFVTNSCFDDERLQTSSNFPERFFNFDDSLGKFKYAPKLTAIFDLFFRIFSIRFGIIQVAQV